MPKDVRLEDKTKINITKGFLSFYKTKEGNTIWYIVVQEFTKEEELKKAEVSVVESIDAEDLDDLQLPF